MQDSSAQVSLIEQELKAYADDGRRREYRITASKFCTVIKYRRNHTSLAQHLLYPEVTGPVLALIWGHQHESNALEAYRLTLDSSCTINQVGVCCGHLGASPDRVVKDGNEDPIRLIEVKCP